MRPVGEGVSELRIDYGPGYRVDFVQRGRTLAVLLAGGDKDAPDRDIRMALELAASSRSEVNMAKTQTRPWDVVEHLETEEDMAAYLEAVLEEGDPRLITASLVDIARARGMAQVARDAVLGRESLSKTLSPEGNPEFATVL